MSDSTRRHVTAVTCLSMVLSLAACQDHAPSTAAAAPASDAASAPPSPSQSAAQTPATDGVDAQKPAHAADAFTGKVWKVIASSDGSTPGSTYAFLHDGTLVISGRPGDPDGYGKWTLDGGKLTIEEEGIRYPTDILSSDADHLQLRSHNPGGTLDLSLVRVPDAPLPEARTPAR